MTWRDLKPLAPSEHQRHAAVKLSLTEAGGRYAQALSLIIKATMLPGIDWLVAGAAVRVQIGADVNAGMLRISKGGPYSLRKVTGKNGPGLVRLRLPAGSRASTSARKPAAVEFDFTEEWVSITLPDWGWTALPQSGPAEPSKPAVVVADAAFAPTKPAVVVANAASAPTKPRPYAGVMSRVPDPALALQQQRGGRVR